MVGALMLAQLLSAGGAGSPAFIIAYYLTSWMGKGYLALAGGCEGVTAILQKLGGGKRARFGARLVVMVFMGAPSLSNCTHPLTCGVALLQLLTHPNHCCPATPLLETQTRQASWAPWAAL